MQRLFQFLQKHILIFLILLSAVLGLLRFNSLQLGTSYDDAKYIILAESLSSGQGYRIINFPRPQIEQNFPPGWPILLTPLTFLFPGNYSVLKFFTLILTLASVYLTYKIFSKRLQSPYLEILTGLVALNPLIVGTSVTVMSESAYLFFSLLALYLFDKWQNGNESGLHLPLTAKNAKPQGFLGVPGDLAVHFRHLYGGKSGLILLVALAAFYTQLIRTIGISLFIALIIYLLVTRRFREMLTAVAVLVAGTLLQGWLSGSLISTGYRTQVFNSSIPEKIGQMTSNFLGYFNETTAGALLPIFGARLTATLGNYELQWLPFALNLLILLLILLGLYRSRGNISLLDVYFIIYIAGVLSFWNPNVGSVKPRFLIPIIPFLYFYFLQGMSLLTKNNVRIAYAVSIVIAFTLLARNLQDWRSPIMKQMTDLSIGAGWVAENAAADAIVMVNEPVPSYVHVRRKTINFPKQGQDLQKYLDNQGIDYIIIAPLLQSPRSTDLEKSVSAALDVMTSAPDIYQLVFEDTENQVFVFQYQGSQ
jgi:hypothetical protein